MPADRTFLNQTPPSEPPSRPLSFEASPIVEPKIIHEPSSIQKAEVIENNYEEKPPAPSPVEKPVHKDNSFLNLLKSSNKNKKSEMKERVESQLQQNNSNNKIKLPQSVLQKYEGKSREVRGRQGHVILCFSPFTKSMYSVC